jgi:alpha-beta hydrolase superfamily lysophospholipase
VLVDGNLGGTVDGDWGGEDGSLVAQVHAAESAGFDGVWTTEMKHDPFLPLAVATQHTDRLDLGTGIAVAFARNPMTVAVAANDLQTLSAGRFTLGLGSQVRPHIERRFGMSWNESCSTSCAPASPTTRFRAASTSSPSCRGPRPASSRSTASGPPTCPPRAPDRTAEAHHPTADHEERAVPTTYTYQGAGDLPVTVYRWDPEGAPRAIVQITHGMGEHAGRYAQFAEFLTGRGFVVHAQDQRGHGATAATDADLGRLGETGWDDLITDIGLLGEAARAAHPGLPLVLAGHSMGSFAVQQYLLGAGDTVDAVLLTGTTALDALEPGLDLDQPLDLSMFNAPFQPARTDYDWLTRDDDIVDAYVADPRCGFGLDLPSGKAMFARARRLADDAAVARIPADLPIHLVAGELDPVNGGGALVELVAERFRAAGLTDVTTVVYPEARHEILNETNRDEVDREIAEWLDRVVGS